MRRPIKKKHELEPDIRYGSTLVTKVINYIMIGGKKAVARRIIYDAMAKAEAQLKEPGLAVLEKAIDNVGPVVELKSRRVGGANYQVPIEVRPERRLSLAIRWMIAGARAGKGRAMGTRFTEELINAFNNTGNAVKKRADVQRMAEANRAFAHLAW